MGQIYDIIEDCVIDALEHDDGIWLPEEFEVMLEDEQFVRFLEEGLVYPDGKKVPLTLKRILVTIQGFKILVRSDKDPEQWAIVPFKECLN